MVIPPLGLLSMSKTAFWLMNHFLKKHMNRKQIFKFHLGFPSYLFWSTFYPEGIIRNAIVKNVETEKNPKLRKEINK